MNLIRFLLVFQGKIQMNESRKKLNCQSRQFNVDKISDLPEDLLVHILSLLPTTNDIVATSGVSKRWESLWTKVHKLRFNDRIYDGKRYDSFLHFVEKSLILHKAPTLVSLRLSVGPKCTADDIGLWIKLALDRNICELIIKHYPDHGHIRLSRRLCDSKTLVSLKLKNAILGAIWLPTCFISLKTLHLRYVKYSGDESVRTLISSCPSLRNLVVKRHNEDNVKRFAIIVRYLQSLTVYLSPLHGVADSDAYVINTPNLKYLNIKDHYTDLCSFEDMPYLDEANLDVAFTHTENFFESLTSVKKLSLCLKKSNAQYPEGIIFSQLDHLELCTCDDSKWLNILAMLLPDSPKLRVLKLNDKNHDFVDKYCSCTWNQQPSYVPECLTKSLEIFEWRNYKATFRERDVAVYILKNSTCLKKTVISPKLKISGEICDHHIIREDLASLFMGSSSCELKFD
ncbi:FBD, F-box, Skp2-like and Leucine Rich Repeat domains containing protein [Arabidopsis thaliana]|uniref:Putative FBD-associated F-box protein At5g56400 n=1 Tax=Arabidopsis thaliana TaxID=3702 RepID=FBD23_ARATH|nr:FBD, F-box, Skp2-like and Leucine Rich Repeat domains containing protein [Arabidopsis thaliana]Q9FM91.2 RecName: Full=Putative FBD-associated F-box protein At5g56400 [Arabidopsis thaliana]AED96760.1 FBD, F-box, Skp2-like and Leucine Rich Repeat domains containing protein [Arabidopsis thaliana]|eukprot:NP_200451.2 FBD, F-box, Skp2-like and Leucine Rich Repeat domains containing protein [Arabidopsis thaliana]